MRHAIKFVGLVLAVLGLSAGVGGSVAGASQLMTASNVNAKISGDQVPGNKVVLTVEGTDFECETVHFETAGEIGSPTPSFILAPTFGSCKYSFISSVKTEGCGFEFTTGSQVGTGGGTVHFNAPLHLVCLAGSKIVITAGTCEMTISGGQTLGGPVMQNIATSPITVRLDFGSSGIAVTKTKDGFLCPLSGTGAATGTLSGLANLGAKSGGTSVSLTVE